MIISRLVVVLVLVVPLVACTSAPKVAPPRPRPSDRSPTPGTLEDLSPKDPPRGGMMVAWDQAIPGMDQGRLQDDGERVVVITHGGFHALDAKTGRGHWTHRDPEGRILMAYGFTGGTLVSITGAREFSKVSETTKQRVTGIDAETGDELWHRTMRLERWGLLEDDPKRRIGRVPAREGVILLQTDPASHPDDPSSFLGITARTGKTAWKGIAGAFGQDCDGSIEPADGDGSLSILNEHCRNTDDRIAAVDPATGKTRWRRTLPDASDSSINGISIADGNAVIEYPAGGTVLHGRDGAKLMTGIGCADQCGLGVAGGDVIVWDADRIRSVDADGGDERSRPYPGNGRRVLAGGRLYGLRASIVDGEDPPDTFPSALEIIDPKWLRGRRTPLPGSFAPSAVLDVAAAKPSIMVLGRTPTGLSVSAFIPDKAGDGPAELGGVHQREWPDACSLSNARAKDKKTDEKSDTAELGDVTIRNRSCKISVLDGSQPEGTITIDWVAPTAAWAGRLLAPVEGERIDGLGDEAYLVDDVVRLRVGRYLVTVNESAGSGRRLARQVAKNLRR